ncbi:MAG: hypothetical protein AB7G93_13730 [Bdellovibrionales bacterium]
MRNQVVLSTPDESTWQIDLLDIVDEHTLFPTPGASPPTKIGIDFGQINYINSAGVRVFTRWLRSLAESCPNLELTFSRLPTSVLRIAESSRLVAAPTVVTSVYCEYFCDTCDETKQILLENSPALTIGNENCDKCQISLEPEILPRTFNYIAGFAPKSTVKAAR